jgi:hypothetical protein
MVIRRVSLRRFRGFERLEWHPQPGLNCLVGPGDTGKTTILEAIGRAVSPAPGGPASEHDYFERRTEDGFEIELVIGDLSPELKGSFRPPALWGWQGEEQPLRQAPLETTEPVLRLLVRGTADLELEHRLLSPDGEELFFSVDKRRLFGLCRVGDARGSAREFRMARGSLLERTLGREDVRGAAAVAVRNASKALQLPQEVEGRLKTLGDVLSSNGVAHDPVTLEVLSPPGQSLLGLLGLALGLRGEAIGLSYAGQGTQRLASFVLARELALSPPLVVVDEVELGLEPYRRRLLVQQLRELLAGGGQAFLTTHSSTVLSELEVEEVHRLAWHRQDGDGDGDADGTQLVPRLTRLSSSLAKTKDADPEALLCRLPVVCEGQTERELLRVLLEQHAKAAGYSLAALGIQLVDGGGQPNVFPISTRTATRTSTSGSSSTTRRGIKDGVRSARSATRSPLAPGVPRHVPKRPWLTTCQWRLSSSCSASATARSTALMSGGANSCARVWDTTASWACLTFARSSARRRYEPDGRLQLTSATGSSLACTPRPSPSGSGSTASPTRCVRISSLSGTPLQQLPPPVPAPTGDDNSAAAT